MANEPLTPEQQLTVLAEKIKAHPEGDNLTIKVLRRRVNGSLNTLEHLASFDGSRAEHVASPELWLPPLAGGGHFMLRVYPAADKMRQLVSDIPFLAHGEPRPIDFEALKDPNWAGPPQMIFPVPPRPMSVSPVQPSHFSTMASPASQPHVLVGPTPALGQVPGAPLDPFATERERLREREREVERALADLRTQQQQAASDAKIAAMEGRYEKMLSEQRISAASKDLAVRPPSVNLAEVITAAVAAIGTLLTPIMTATAQSAERRAQADAERDRRADERHREFMQTVVNRPVIDPGVLTLMERQTANETSPAAMITQVMGPLSTMMSMNMDMARMVAESTGGPPDNPIMIAFREVSSAIQEIMKSSMRVSKPKPRQGPPAVQQQPRPVTPTPSTPIQQQPHVQAAPRAADVVIDAPSPAFNGAPTENIVNTLVAMVRAHHNPHEVAQLLVNSFNTPDFQHALVGADHDIATLFQQHLGDAWINDMNNTAYTQSLMAAIVPAGHEAGIFNEDSNEPDEEESGEPN